jgi:O-antigen/teichoic acid export membrane protein
MVDPIRVTGKQLTRNWTFNLLGQALPLLIALPTIPYVIHGMGPERFGILSIAWVLLGYVGFLDLGLSRATTKFVAEYLGRGEAEKLPSLVWTSVWAQVLFGIAGTLLTSMLIPVLVDRVLKVPPLLRVETKMTFFILAASLPIVLASNAFRGVLEAGQHFDAVNYVKAPSNASIFLLPAIALPFGFGLPGIVFMLVLARLATVVAYLLYCFKFFPSLRHDFSIDSKMLRPLLVFGGWVTVTNTVSPLMTNMDRFFIGSMISMTAVGYYTAPYEAITRAWMFPVSLAATIFPAFSSLDAEGSRNRLGELYARSLKSLLLILGPILLLVVAFSSDILRLWLGPEFAAQSAVVLQVIAIGVLLSSLALIAFSLLQGLGRPDLAAKFHLFELPLYVGLLWFLVKHWGIVGAAVAWTIRVALDTTLLFGAVVWLKLFPPREFADNNLRRAIILVIAFGFLVLLPGLAGLSSLNRVLFAGFLSTAFMITAWSFVLDSRDRSLLISAAERFRGASSRTK